MKVVLTSFVKQLMAVGICCAVGELNLSPASATPAAVSGPSALALAAVVASHGSQLGSFDKRAMLRLFDGKSVVITRVNKITVAADSITCKMSDVDITARTVGTAMGRPLPACRTPDAAATLPLLPWIAPEPTSTHIGHSPR